MRVPTAAPDDLVRDIRSGLAGKRFDIADHVVILEGEVAVGVIALESLLSVLDGQTAREVMTPDPATVVFKLSQPDAPIRQRSVKTPTRRSRPT